MMLWSTLAIVGSLTFAGARSNVKWLVIYLLLTIVTGFIDGFVKPYGIETPPTVTTVFFVINIVITSSIVFGLTIFLLERREQANHDLEELLEKVEQKVEERTKELQIKNTQLENLSSKLAKYLSPQVYDLIFSGTKEVKIETYRKKLTVFFSDIVGFTELTDQMESEPLATLLNNYLNEMSEIALRHGGTIDKFIGDAVMVFFGDPDTKGEKEDAIACTLMAFEMRERMKYLSKYWGEQGISKPLQIRIGINSGFCTVGNFGSENRLDYTIVGGQVNLASRLETNAKPGQILISHETYALVKDKVICEEKEDIQVKGISSAIQTYQVLDLRRKETTEKFVIKDEHDGYSLSININRANKDLVVDSLRGALQEMDSHIQDKNTTNKSI
ncbi:MAG: adenylate/guanylate cyclase domain-containing protein [Nitrospina sp.]|nr:adenylate/guanylate cyclase domain-containing protein [Nitrospina sp.]